MPKETAAIYFMPASIPAIYRRAGLLAAVSIAVALQSGAAGQLTLKDAFKDHFYVGVAINRRIATSAPVAADNVSRNLGEVERDVALVKEQFDQISPENDLKWQIIQPRPGAAGYDFGPADAYVNFGASNNMFIVGHVLVWHSQTPDWVFAGTNPPPFTPNTLPTFAAGSNGWGTNGSTGRRLRRFAGGGFAYRGPRASREELLERMRDHIFNVVGRYKGKVKVWDVVNEAVSDSGTNVLRNSLWEQIIGPDFIAKAFQYAHEADPDAILRYNDYSLEDPVKRRKLMVLIKSLQAQHVPVMAIGSQTHVHLGSPTFEQEDKALSDLETLGLPIHISELDVNNSQAGQGNTGADVASMSTLTGGGLVDNANQRLADEYVALFKAFLKHKSVKVVTFWGVNDSVTWLRGAKPLLFDANDQPKPAFDEVINEAKGDEAAR